jgi:hypothetical protein
MEEYLLLYYCLCIDLQLLISTACTKRIFAQGKLQKSKVRIYIITTSMKQSRFVSEADSLSAGQEMSPC